MWLIVTVILVHPTLHDFTPTEATGTPCTGQRLQRSGFIGTEHLCAGISIYRHSAYAISPRRRALTSREHELVSAPLIVALAGIVGKAPFFRRARIGSEQLCNRACVATIGML